MGSPVVVARCEMVFYRFFHFHFQFMEYNNINGSNWLLNFGATYMQNKSPLNVLLPEHRHMTLFIIRAARNEFLPQFNSVSLHQVSQSI